MLRIILSMVKSLEKIAKQKKIKYFLVTFVDLFGVQRAKLVPTRAIGEMQKTGAGFGGFATHLDLSFSEPDMFALPDPDSLIQLPWQPDVGWLASDLVMNNKLMDQCPRVILKNQIENLDKLNLKMMTGVECEFFILNEDGTEVADNRDDALKPCYDVAALMRRFDVLSEICDSMIKLGWKPYQNDHEDANGQFEMNWDFSDCLITADRHAFFKFMVKSIAEKHNLRATFMPKPFTHLTGNGCHCHVSVWDKSGKKNMFLDKKDELGLSKTGYNFLGGIMESADKMAAVFNPTINSYKRINGSVTTSGATWSPSSITWAGNNRTHMVRVPGAGRFELRLMDGATNPYLLQAGIMLLGLDGLNNKRDPGKRLDINMYTEGHKAGKVKKLPLNLLDAIRDFDKSKIIRAGFGDELVNSYVKLKNQDWSTFNKHLSSWERETTLDC